MSRKPLPLIYQQIKFSQKDKQLKTGTCIYHLYKTQSFYVVSLFLLTFYQKEANTD